MDIFIEIEGESFKDRMLRKLMSKPQMDLKLDSPKTMFKTKVKSSKLSLEDVNVSEFKFEKE